MYHDTLKYVKNQGYLTEKMNQFILSKTVEDMLWNSAILQ